MERILGRASWTTAFVAVFLAFIMLGSPTLGVSDNKVDLGVVDNAAAAAGSRTVTIGIVDLKGGVSTLNPLQYTMAEEMMVIWPCYSYLLQYDVDGSTRIGDLARKWSMSPNGLTWNFTITPNAVFYDKARVDAGQLLIPLTGRDVVYTFGLIQNETTKNNLHSYFPTLKVGGVSVPILKKMTLSPDLLTITIELATQYAPFANSLTALPILPRYIWNTVDYSRFANNNIVGSGPWYYETGGLPTGLTCTLKKSPTWFATEERGWELRVDTMVLMSETSEDANLADFRLGNVDIMMWPSADQYLEVLVGSEWADVYKAAISSGFVYEYNICGMTEAMRDALGYRGTTNPVLQDPIVRKAIAMTVDKQAFINAVRGGLGAPATSLVPESHPYSYVYGSNPAEDTGLVTFDPQAARTMLRNAGWTYDISGAFVPEWDLETYPLCQYGGANALQFRFYTLAESPEWDKGARLLAQWAQEAGIDLWSGYEIKSTNEMNGIWAAADYDLWLWDWVFTPSSEISVDILSVLTSMEIGSWSDVYWSNPTFDALYNQSLVEMDPVARKIITDELQRINYESYFCQLVAYRADLYVASPRGPDKWVNWGDWQNHWILTPDQLAPFVFMTMQPSDQLAPKISSATVPGAWTVGTPMSVAATATDSQGVQYRWFFDNEGNTSAWSSTGGSSHTYTRDGLYTVYLAVRETSGLDTFTNWTKFTVLVSDDTNTPPTAVSWWYSPEVSINAGTWVYLNVTGATDPNADQMYFSWDFGDGYSATGTNVMHQFQKGIPASVNLSVDDHRYGSGTRPVVVPHIIDVGPNGAPSISVPDRTAIPVIPRTSALMWFTTSDTPAGDPHRYTWDFGDGTPLVVTLTNETSHTYQRQGTYTMRCWADDLTGISGHNQTDTGTVLVSNTVNQAPSGISAGVSLKAVVRYQTVTYYANATDNDRDDIFYTFDFGDGTPSYTTVVPWNSKTVETTHSYATTGTKIARVTFYDGIDTVQSTPIGITVAMGNREPVIDPVSNIQASVGSTRTFTATATDPDGDSPLTYSWQFYWRNESGIIQHANVPGQTVTFTWNNGSGAAGYLFRVFVNDNNMTSVTGPWNVSDGGYAYVNAVPRVISSPPNNGLTAALTDYSFEVVAWDNDTLDNSSLVYTWDWGDGTTTVETDSGLATHQWPQSVSDNVDRTVTVHIDDAFVDDLAVSHNLTRTFTVHVYTYTLSLTKGWNLVTVPPTGFAYRSNNLGLLANDQVAAYDSLNKTYKTYIVGTPFGVFNIEGSTGYWVYVNQNETLYLHGQMPTTSQSKSVNLPANGGWAILAYNSLKTTMKASSFRTAYTGGTVTTVATFDPITKTYKTWVFGGPPPTDFFLVPGQAYWVYATASGTLSYSP